MSPLNQSRFEEDRVEPEGATSKDIRVIAKRFWGSEEAGDFSTYEGKALAAARIQDRQHAKECLILCDFHWPLIYSQFTEDHVGDPTLENQICSAVTGNPVDEWDCIQLVNGYSIFSVPSSLEQYQH